MGQFFIPRSRIRPKTDTPVLEMGQSFILLSRVQQEYNSLLVNALNRIFKSNLSLNKKSEMAAYKTGALVRSKYYTPF